MKTRALVMAAVVALTAMATTRVAQAQERRVTVDIPFDFVAGNTQLPAGEYAVIVTGPTNSLILISAKGAAASAFISTNAAVSAEPQTESKLVFNRYGNRYFLSQVWQQGNAQGRQLLKSAREKEVLQSTEIQDQSQVVLVAGLATTTR